MYCEFYIDVFFAVNLLMDFWVLCLTNVLLKGTASPLRAFWGAVFGALGMCGFLVFSREIHTAGLVIFTVSAYWLWCVQAAVSKP